MRVLVTGSSGFVGRHVVRELAARDHDVVALDLVASPDSVPGVSELVGDLMDRHWLIRTLSDHRPEAVVHLAARTDIDNEADLGGYAVNIEGVRNLVDAIRAGSTVRRAIFTSSQLVCRVGYVPKADDDYQPNTLYGESKVLTEQIVRSEEGGGVEWCLVRPTTVWGPGIIPHYQRLFRMIAAGTYVHVGRRPLYKSYGYAGNVAHQYGELLVADGARISKRTLYLADYEPLSLREWVEEIRRQIGAPAVRTIPESIARVGASVGDVLNRLGWRRFPFNSFRLGNVLTEYVFDLEPTAQVCGPLPYSMEEGVAATISWLRKTGVLPRPRLAGLRD